MKARAKRDRLRFDLEKRAVKTALLSHFENVILNTHFLHLNES